jgi:hypothetical protein
VSRRLLLILLSLAAIGAATPGPAGAAEPVPEFLTQFGENCGDLEEIFAGKCGAAGETVLPRGVATNPDNGHVFVVDQANSRIDEFTAWGEFVKAWGWGVVASGPGDKPQNERQQISVDATAGSFRLVYLNESHNQTTTEPIAFDASAATVQAAFTGLPGAVAVSGPAGGPWTIEFIGSQADAEIPPLEIVESTLSGGAATATVETLQNGANFEICVPAQGDVCRAGQPGIREGLGSGLVGQLDIPLGIAVDSVGDLYVGDWSHRRVQKFDSDGHFLLMIGGGVDRGPHHPGNLCTAAYIAEGDECGPGTTGSAPGQFSASWPFSSYVAVGPGDVLYVGDEERIQKFNPDGTYQGEIALPGQGSVSSLAVAPSGNVFLATIDPDGLFPHPDVEQLDPSGAPICTIAVERPTALAADADGNVYVFATNRFELDASEIREYDPSCEALTAFGGHDFVEGSTGIGVNTVGDVYASNLSPAGTNSYIRAYGPGPIAFEPPPAADPVVISQYATGVSADAATLGAQINPRFWPDAHYYLQYGEADCSLGGCTAQPAPPGPLLTDKSVNGPVATAPIELTGLKGGITYHYRFAAQSSGGGPVFGPDQTFTTYSVAPPALPDGRVFELVSPPNKGGGEVAVPTAAGGGAEFTVEPLQASPDGSAITYTSFTSFGADPESAPAASQYLSKRGAGGWSTDNINPRFEEGYVRDPLVGFSPDLAHAAVIALEPELTPDAALDVPNIYRRDNSSGALQAITTAEHQPQLGVPQKDYCVFYGGASEDFSRVFFGAKAAMLPGDPAGNGFNLYEWTAADGLRLVSVLPDGSKAVPGVITSFGALGRRINEGCNAAPEPMRHAISADGSKAFWSYDGTFGTVVEPLLASVDGAETIRLDAPEGVVGKGGVGRYQDATPDGSKAFFIDIKKLTTEATTLNSNDLYRYDFDAEEGSHLTNLSAHVGEAAEVKGVLGVSGEGDYAYFVANGVLDPAPNSEGESAVAGQNNLYAWHEGEGVRFLGTLAAGDSTDWERDLSLQTARVSPDGRSLAFVSRNSLTGFDNASAPGSKCTLASTACAEAFLYDYAADSLDCASCNRAGAKPIGPATLPTWHTPYQQPRYLTDDGGRLFFETYDALDPHDTNGKQDVYEFERPGTGSCTAAAPTYNPASGGCVFLISSGASEDESYFLDASTSADDAFVSTRQGLVFDDEDGRYDVYDARVGGVSPTPPPPPCEGEACRQGGPAAPPASAPGSGFFHGPGDPATTRKKCPKGKRAVKRHGKTVCVKKGKKHHQKQHRKHHQRSARRAVE